MGQSSRLFITGGWHREGSHNQDDPDSLNRTTTPSKMAGSSIDHTRLRLFSGNGYSMYLAVARATASP